MTFELMISTGQSRPLNVLGAVFLLKLGDGY